MAEDASRTEDHDASSIAASPDAEREPKRRRMGGVFQRARVPRRKAACQLCRSRKVKCDSMRPTCGSCSNDGSQCVYVDPPPGQQVYVHSCAPALRLTPLAWTRRRASS